VRQQSDSNTREAGQLGKGPLRKLRRLTLEMAFRDNKKRARGGRWGRVGITGRTPRLPRKGEPPRKALLLNQIAEVGKDDSAEWRTGNSWPQCTKTPIEAGDEGGVGTKGIGYKKNVESNVQSSGAKEKGSWVKCGGIRFHREVQRASRWSRGIEGTTGRN